MLGFYSEKIFRIVSRINEKYISFSTLIRLRFDEAAAYFPDKHIDILHIDGRHGYDDVKEDFELCGPSFPPTPLCFSMTPMFATGNSGSWRYFRDSASAIDPSSSCMATASACLPLATSLLLWRRSSPPTKPRSNIIESSTPSSAACRGQPRIWRDPTAKSTIDSAASTPSRRLAHPPPIPQRFIDTRWRPFLLRLSAAWRHPANRSKRQRFRQMREAKINALLEPTADQRGRFRRHGFLGGSGFVAVTLSLFGCR